MHFSRTLTTAALALGLTFAAQAGRAQAFQTPVPSTFESTGADRQAIQALLDTYTRAVSTKDRALFRTILLNDRIPFSDAGSAANAKGAEGGTQRYAGFDKGVFDGAPFTQTFRDVHIAQDGPLAQVSLVFVNTAPDGASWGWKIIQLLKIDGNWKIASEFYTNHR